MAGIWSRLFPGAAPEPEQRRNATASFARPGWSMGMASGASPFTTAKAQNLSAVLACSFAISSALASLPVVIYRKTATGREVTTDHPIAHLIEDGVNDYQDFGGWLEMMICQVLWNGNALSIINTDDSGAIRSLIPVPWNAGVLLSLLPNARLVYDVLPMNYVSVPVKPGRYFSDEVWHLRDLTDNGLVGSSRLSRAPELLAGMFDLQTYSSSVFRNGTAPSGILTHPGVLSNEAKQELMRSFSEVASGPANARKTPILEEGMTFSDGGACSPEDSELLASRRFMVIEICRIFGVPPAVVAAYEDTSFLSAQQADEWFAKHSLLPWAKKIESQFRHAIFGAGSEFSLELDFAGMLRGNYETRWATGLAAVAAGVLTRDELRQAEGYPPLPPDVAPAYGAAAGAGGVPAPAGSPSLPAISSSGPGQPKL